MLGTSTSTISLRDNVLTENTEYQLWFAASGGWGRTSEISQTGKTLRTNIPPYNGNCIATPAEGNPPMLLLSNMDFAFMKTVTIKKI